MAFPGGASPLLPRLNSIFYVQRKREVSLIDGSVPVLFTLMSIEEVVQVLLKSRTRYPELPHLGDQGCPLQSESGSGPVRSADHPTCSLKCSQNQRSLRISEGT